MKTKGGLILGILGSRSLSDERVKIIILEAIDKYKPEILCTAAEPGGVCEVARDIARASGANLLLCHLNFRYLRGAFARRTDECYKYMEHVIFIHDGVSQGCANEKALAIKKNIPYDYYKLEPAEYEKSIGFKVKKGWDEIDFELNKM